MDGGYVPVVAPVAEGPDGRPLNINADYAAGAIAGALQAGYFVLMSDVPGVLDKIMSCFPASRGRILRLSRPTEPFPGV